MTTNTIKQQFKDKINELSKTYKEPSRKFTEDDKKEMVRRAIIQLRIQLLTNLSQNTKENIADEVLRQSRMEAMKRTA
jgi:hypothetical protein